MVVPGVPGVPGLKEQACSQSIILIRDFGVEERQHATNLVHTRHLRTQQGVFVKVALDKFTVLACCNLTLATNASATRMTNNLSVHKTLFVIVNVDM